MGLQSAADITLRSIVFIFLVIILGLTGSLIYSQEHSNARVNFALFVSVFGLVTSSFYGLASYFIEYLKWPLILFTLDFLNFVFTFSGAIALAAGIRVHSCSNDEYVNKNSITQGSHDRCRKAQATTAFLFFAFVIFVISAILSLVSLISGGAFGGRSSKPRAGVPTISTA